MPPPERRASTTYSGRRLGYIPRLDVHRVKGEGIDGVDCIRTIDLLTV
jgi:hypothetical protein